MENSKWITISGEIGDVCPVFRRRFGAGTDVERAELQITALGVYEAELNGQRVGDFVLAPGWTSYAHRLQVQTYDVTKLLREQNELRVTVGRGWLRSPMPGWFEDEHKRSRYNQPCGLIARLVLSRADGTEVELTTDETWQWGESPVRFSEIYDGERYDARFTTDHWQSVALLDWSRDILIPQEGEIVREMGRVAAKRVIRTPTGETLIDFGQEVTGYVEFTVDAKAGEMVRFTHGEVLDREGNFYNENYRARSTELLVKSGELLGRDMSAYKALHEQILTAFRGAFPDYRTQTEHVLAVQFGIAQDPQRTADALAGLVVRDGTQLRTGFVGTPYLLHVLSKFGHSELAWSLLLRQQYPGWLYSVNKGATTIWEHWDGIREDGSFWSIEMNSYNHYSYGAVADWVFEQAAGISHDEAHPGFTELVYAPHPDRRVGSLRATLETRQGRISAAWRYVGDAVRYDLETPVPVRVHLDGQETLLKAGTHTFWG